MRLASAARVGRLALQAGDELRANTFDVDAVEMRRGQRRPQQLEGFVLVVLEHPQGAAEIIPRDAETQFDRAAVEMFVKRPGIQVARTLIDEVGDHVADAGLAVRILHGAAVHGEFHRDQRHGRILHEPGLDAAGRNQVLDLGGGVRGAGHHRREATQTPATRARRGAPDLEEGHERFSACLGVMSLMR